MIALTCTFVLQQDRRQVADRRSTWRGGCRVTDFVAFGERGRAATEPSSAVVSTEVIGAGLRGRAPYTVRAVVSS